MNIKIIAVGKLKEEYRAAEAEFVKRISKFAKVTVVQLKDEQLLPGKEKEALKIEGRRVLDHIKERETVVALALEGREYDSVAYAKHLNQSMVSGVSDLTFIIGGSAGLDGAVLKRADELLCFSKFTFSHQIMRVILLEQIYRAFTIIHGQTYHK